MKFLLLTLFIIIPLCFYGQTFRPCSVDGDPITQSTALKHIKHGKVYILEYDCKSYDYYHSKCEQEIQKKYNFSYRHVHNNILIPPGLDSLHAYNKITKKYLSEKFEADWDSLKKAELEFCLTNYPCLEGNDVDLYLKTSPVILFNENSFILTAKAKCIIDSIYIPMFLDVLSSNPGTGVLVTGYMHEQEKIKDSSIASHRAEVVKAYFISKGVSVKIIKAKTEYFTGMIDNADTRESLRKATLGFFFKDE